MGFESPKFEEPKGKLDLTTSEGRQKEIERVMAEEEKEKPEERVEKEEKPKEEVEKEKSSKELQLELEKTRSDYAQSYNEYRKALGGIKEKDLKADEKTVEHARKFIEPGDSELIEQGFKPGVMSPEEKQLLYDAEGRKKNFIETLEAKGIKKDRAEATYNAELKKEEYDDTKEQLGKKLAEQGIGKTEIFKQLVINERELLNQAKVESWPPKEKNILRKGMEWWMKRGTATRLLISTGLVTGVVASVGGFGAAAIATYAGYRFVRGFGSVMIGKLAGKGVDIALSRGIEAKHESSLAKLKEGFDPKNLKQTEKELEKIFEERAKKERRKLLIKGVTMAVAGAGTAIGMGMLEHAWAGGVKVVPEAPEVPTKPVAAPGVMEAQPEILPEPTPPVENINITEVVKGDSVWKLSEEQLELRGYFRELTGTPDEILAKKNYLIDAVKDKIAENPGKFGIVSGDADIIKPGEKIDFSSIFQNQDDINSIIEKAGGLKSQDIENILHPDTPVESPAGVVEERVSVEEASVSETSAPKSGIKESWTDAGKKVEYVDEKVSKIPESYYTRPDEAARIIAEQAVKDPVFYEKISNIMGDSYFRYENFRNFKIGLLLDKQGPQWRAIEEHFGEIKGLKPEEYLAIDSGTKNLLERTKNVFENINNPIEKDAVRNLTLDQFLRKYFNKL